MIMKTVVLFSYLIWITFPQFNVKNYKVFKKNVCSGQNKMLLTHLLNNTTMHQYTV